MLAGLHQRVGVCGLVEREGRMDDRPALPGLEQRPDLGFESATNLRLLFDRPGAQRRAGDGQVLAMDEAKVRFPEVERASRKRKADLAQDPDFSPSKNILSQRMFVLTTGFIFVVLAVLLIFWLMDWAK